MTARRLAAMIDAAGMTPTRFARDVLGRDERTVRRWLAGETIPHSAAQWLERLTVTDSDGAVVVEVAPE